MQVESAQLRQSTLHPTVTVTGALRAMEALLLGGGQQTARRNAWSAVVEDRRRAKDRREVQHVIEALNPHPGSRNTGPDSL
ncbi:hypothetical protein QMK19_07095 [Streptomyces sp. H10-C2]|uniref:SCO2195 family GlnR-regulated protein n=1 Tax=unclassified Streptomyces TaxID=2593676 RepID=UPI0024BB73C0|nr:MULTISPECIES: hypothetical protein [unclassified Streptomyces]MDJ0341203.1 hypothetical protein [Streptomyces sp. PH10-H1]MDJ0369444.1 hypothetical protein [Streptomyces sp. H10-C2]